MERTNYVARAKQLLTQSARTAALVIAPLAAAASAHANNSFGMPITNLACSTVGSGDGTCSSNSGDSQLPLVHGIAGVSFFNAADQNWTIDVSSGSSAVLTLSANGMPATVLPEGAVVPVSYDFTLATSGGVSIESWSLVYDLGTSLGNAAQGSYTATGGAGGGTFSSDTGTITTTTPTTPGATLFETVILTVVPNESTGAVVITAPFDIGSQGSATPEPATLGTLGTGFGLLAWLYRRRKRA
jgi:hypothetical protein